jgi:hypothetical protein
MLDGETKPTMNWVWVLAYKGNKKFLDGPSWKCSINKKKENPWEQAVEALYNNTREVN